MTKVFVSTRSFAKADPEPMNLLKNAGLCVELNPYGRALTPEESIRHLDGTAGLLAGTERLDDAVFSKAPSLKVISRVGAGMDSVDVAAAKRRGIRVYSTPGAPTQAVAELALGLMLSALRSIPAKDAALRSGKWDAGLGRQLAGATVGLVGFGRIGRAVAELLTPFHCRILVHDSAPVSAPGVEQVPLEELLSASLVVTLHVPLSGDTRGLIGARELALMRSDAVLVNTSRGGVVDEEALAGALRAGRPAAAALDVFASEPYKGPLTGLPNIILTPHMASATTETRRLMELEAARNLLAGLGLDPSGGTR